MKKKRKKVSIIIHRGGTQSLRFQRRKERKKKQTFWQLERKSKKRNKELFVCGLTIILYQERRDYLRCESLCRKFFQWQLDWSFNPRQAFVCCNWNIPRQQQNKLITGRDFFFFFLSDFRLWLGCSVPIYNIKMRFQTKKRGGKKNKIRRDCHACPGPVTIRSIVQV